MAFQVVLKSREQFLGDLYREILANTDLNSVAPGSTLATMLEAIATAQFQIQLSALKILQSTNIEALSGNDLDKKAEAIKLPNGIGGVGRRPAGQASGTVTIGSSFVKISSKLYAGKPAPFAGSTNLYVEDASSFPATGSIYIARGTVDRFEGPIPYTSVTNNGSFWTIALSSSLTKSHLLSDLVVLAQGGDRTVTAGTTGQIPANSKSPAVSFTTNDSILIPDGESTGTVNVTCTEFGEVGNALAGSITTFTSAPFAGATITNPSSFINGVSTENDEDLRQRIKNYPSTLSRGTKTAILAAVLGATDPATGRTIQSAVPLDPVEPGDSARLYIDDGTGLEPTFGTQAYELLLQNASGQETRFRTAQYPITPAVIEGANFGPFVLQDSQTITVHVDEVIETYTITGSNYVNLNSASAYEIVRDLNSQSNIVGFRTTDNGTRVVMIDLSGQAEKMWVDAGDLQSTIGFSLSVVRPIFLYKNSEIQSFRGGTGTVETRPRSGWNLTPSDLEDVRVAVDGVIQTFTVTDADFNEFGTSISTATVSQYATVFSRKVAGVKFSTAGQIIIWSTWQIFSSSGSVQILETKENGDPAPWIGSDKVWTSVADGGILSSTGFEKNFSFNRFTGEITLVDKPDVGDIIEIGNRSTRANIHSNKTSTGLYTLNPSLTTGNSRLVVGFDGEFAIRSVTVPNGAQITPTKPDATGATNIIRLTANVPDLFLNSEVGDWLYLVQDTARVTWGDAVEGFYRIKARGAQLHAQNVVFPTLPAIPIALPNSTAATTNGSTAVRVTFANHGLKTGDLVTVSTSSAIGGISAGNLSATNTTVVVVNDNSFIYQALAAATSAQFGTIDNIGTNVLIVTQASHGFETGAEVSITTAATISGISGANLSVTNAPITVLSVNTWEFRAAAASTVFPSTSGILNTVTYVADAWIEFEISEPQEADWTAILAAPQNVSLQMINLFRSTTIPQLVDFGDSVSTMSVDDIVTLINNSVVGGSAVKVSPQELDIRSNDFLIGTTAVLAVVGNAINVFSTGVDSSQQAHIANSKSQYTQSGGPVIDGVVNQTQPTLGYGTRAYLEVDTSFLDVIDTNPNPTVEAPTDYVTDYPEGFEHLFVTGRFSGLTGRVYNNQTSQPYTGIMSGNKVVKPLGTTDTVQTNPDSLDRYANFGLRLRDLPLTNNDKLVVEMDLNPTDNTVAIPMFKLAKIQDMDAITGSGKGQVISFRLKDPDDSNKPFFDSTSVYRNFDFTDFAILTRSVGLYREDVSNRALVLRSADFNSPNIFRMSIRLPEQDNQADFQISHINDYETQGRLTLIVNLPSGTAVIPATLSSGIYQVKSTANGTLFDWRITSGLLNSTSGYVVGNILNISGVSSLSGSYLITDQQYVNLNAPSASVTNGSNVVTVTASNHGLADGDLVDTLSTVDIGGILSTDLSVTGTPITYIDANTFSYTANAGATSGATGSLVYVRGGAVTVSSPGSGGLSPVAVYNAAQSPIRTWAITPKTWEDLATAINAYFPDAPVATAQAIGSDFATNPISKPTYMVYPNAVAYSGSDMDGAFSWSSFTTHNSGRAGIWQYDSSNPSLNNIKATVQSDESIYPTTAEASGTPYQPIDEDVIIVPTNSKTLSAWLNFNAVSSLNILANIERLGSDDAIQLSSKMDGSAGAVHVSGVTANGVTTSVIGNATDEDESTQLKILNADAQSMLGGQLVRVQNVVASEILRPYRMSPEGVSITAANTTNIVNYFRQTNSIRYIRVDVNTGRLIFLRNGMGSGQTEAMDVGNEVAFTDLGNGLVQVTSDVGSGGLGTGQLSARVGDMMYIQPTSPFPIDSQCRAVGDKYSAGDQPEYLGYPVVHVIDDNNIIVLAPNITTFSTTTLASSTDIVFMPAIWNEKNIRTNHAEGAKFDNIINNGFSYALVKKISQGLAAIWFQNSPNESTDTMRLADMSVSTDDYAVFGTQFSAVNQGTYQILAHNGRNMMIVANPQAQDQLIDLDTPGNGGLGDRKWRVGPFSPTIRPIRIVAGESVKIGDKLRISTPPSSSQWFNNAFFGTWNVLRIGYAAVDFTGASLPNTPSSGSYDNNYICPYIDFEFPNAPVAVTDSSSAPVDSFLIGANDEAIGFVEGTPFGVYRMIAGRATNPASAENADLFLVPRLNSSKMSETFGTIITAQNKFGFDEQTFQGIDGYKIYNGLVQIAHRIIDGLPTNPVLYPGYKAMGTQIEVGVPLIKTIQVSLQVRPKDGVTLNSISDVVKATVSAYINGLDVGQPVILSEIIRIVQSLPGVLSVKIISTFPAADDDRITVGAIEKCRILNITSDITVG